MRITVLAHGTRGDVYPLTALAAELARRGYQVRVAASANLVDIGRRLGLNTVPIAWDTRHALESARGRAWADSHDPEVFVRLLHELEREHGEQLDREIIDVCADSDAIVSGVLLEWRATALAEAHGIPLIVQDCYPRRMNSVVPHPLMTIAPQPDPAAIQATYRAFARMNWVHLRGPVTAFRRTLGLPALPSVPPQSLQLQAYSPSLVPGLEWDAHRPFVGDLRMSQSDLARLGMASVDTGLAQWLDAGRAPALFTFGSTYIARPAQQLAAISQVCRSLRVRGLVVTGWGLSRDDASAAASPGLRMVPYVDYDAVLPRCTVAVHHGGATITAAAARAGVPALVCSASFDQPFWGAQLERLGVGVHVRHADLTEETLRAGLRRLLAKPVRQRAAQLGSQLRAEMDGTPAAADEIDEYLLSRPERRRGHGVGARERPSPSVHG